MSQAGRYSAGGGGGGSITEITTNAGIAMPVAGNINLFGGHDINTTGVGDTVTVNLNNTITLGDISSLPPFGMALEAVTGDITLDSGNINLPATTDASVGVIYLGAANFVHAFGSSTNTFLGTISGNFTLDTGNALNNTGVGFRTLFSLTEGQSNVAVGLDALTALTTGDSNIAVGNSAGNVLDSGTRNILIGVGAGGSYVAAESSNIVVGNTGTAAESNVIRIGTQGAGTGQQNTCFVAGIVGVTTSNSEMVTIDSTTGQLGAATIPIGVSWVEVTTTSASMAVNTGYIANNAGLVTLTLPATAAQGSIIRVTGKGAGGWRIAQNAGQTIFFGASTTTTGATGHLDSTARRDTIELVCVTANNDFNALSSIGNISVT
jgi:hypothetical protein